MAIALLIFVSTQSSFVHGNPDAAAMSLQDSMTGFEHYMRMLITTKKLPHSQDQQKRDLQNTNLQFVDMIGTQNLPDKLIPLSFVLELKSNYHEYLASLYPQQFSDQSTAQNIDRYQSKNQIKTAVLEILNVNNADQAKTLWKQIKRDLVIPHLNRVTFVDEDGVIVITHDDYNQILQDIRAYTRNRFGSKNGIAATLIGKIKKLFTKE